MPEIPSPEVALEDCQLNWDYAKKNWPPDGDAFTDFAGGWATTVPTPTSGIAFQVKNDGVYLFNVYATAFQTTAIAIAIETYVDGILRCAMILNPTAPQTQHVQLADTFKVLLDAGQHFVAYRQTSGTSDGADRGSVSFSRIA